MLGLGVGEILVIGGALVLLFGAKRIPVIARGIGEGIRNFKGEVKSGDGGGKGDEPPALGGGREGTRPED